MFTKRIREWRKKHEKISQARAQKGGGVKKRLKGGGRKIIGSATWLR